MAKKNKKQSLSLRQQRSQQVMRDKAAQKRLQNLMHRLRIFSGVCAVIIMAGVGFLAWKTSFISHTIQLISDRFYQATADSGYKVETLYLEGRNRTPVDEINSALDIDKGAPIFSLNLSEIRERLEKIESIKYAAVERSLPNTIFVRVVEREPVARWQYQGRISLVDDNGVVMTGLDIAPYAQLPLIVGEGAPKHVADLLKILVSEPEISKRFAAGVWVGDRRWNIRLHRKNETTEDTEIRLPEYKPGEAWKKLAEMQKNKQILDRDLKVIDLRIEGRLFIKVPEDDKPEKQPSNAKDT